MAYRGQYTIFRLHLKDRLHFWISSFLHYEGKRRKTKKKVGGDFSYSKIYS